MVVMITASNFFNSPLFALSRLFFILNGLRENSSLSQVFTIKILGQKTGLVVDCDERTC